MKDYIFEPTYNLTDDGEQVRNELKKNKNIIHADDFDNLINDITGDNENNIELNCNEKYLNLNCDENNTELNCNENNTDSNCREKYSNCNENYVDVNYNENNKNTSENKFDEKLKTDKILEHIILSKPKENKLNLFEAMKYVGDENDRQFFILDTNCGFNNEILENNEFVNNKHEKENKHKNNKMNNSENLNCNVEKHDDLLMSLGEVTKNKIEQINREFNESEISDYALNLCKIKRKRVCKINDTSKTNKVKTVQIKYKKGKK